MQLALCCPRTDGAPRDEVGDVLGRDSIEQLGADGDAKVGQVAEQLTSNAETLVDFEGTVKVGVVDKTFPTDSRPRFLRITN
jgi:hypothetical protein